MISVDWVPISPWPNAHRNTMVFWVLATEEQRNTMASWVEVVCGCVIGGSFLWSGVHGGYGGAMEECS